MKRRLVTVVCSVCPRAWAKRADGLAAWSGKCRFCCFQKSVCKRGHERHKAGTCPLCKREYKQNQHAKKVYRLTLRGKFTNLLSSAKHRGLVCSITFEDFSSIVSSAVCEYCKGPLPRAGTGLDRKDSSQGYIVDNVVPCCAICNSVKKDFYAQ